MVLRWLMALSLLLLPAASLRAEGPLTFEQHVRPILKAHCFQCHGEEDKPKGKLDLRLVIGYVIDSALYLRAGQI